MKTAYYKPKASKKGQYLSAFKQMGLTKAQGLYMKAEWQDDELGFKLARALDTGGYMKPDKIDEKDALLAFNYLLNRP